MRCGALDPESCATGHWCPVFGGHREGAGWRADCPLCHSSRALSWKVNPGRVKWWSFCESHDEDVLRPILATRLPDCVSTRVRPRAADLARIEALAADKAITPSALRVAILQELGWNAERIRGELKMPRQTWSDAVRILGQRPRSAPAGWRPDSRTQRSAGTSGFSDNGQGQRHIGSGLTMAATLIPPGAGGLAADG